MAALKHPWPQQYTLVSCIDKHRQYLPVISNRWTVAMSIPFLHGIVQKHLSKLMILGINPSMTQKKHKFCSTWSALIHEFTTSLLLSPCCHHNHYRYFVLFCIAYWHDSKFLSWAFSFQNSIGLLMAALSSLYVLHILYSCWQQKHNQSQKLLPWQYQTNHTLYRGSSRTCLQSCKIYRQSKYANGAFLMYISSCNNLHELSDESFSAPEGITKCPFLACPSRMQARILSNMPLLRDELVQWTYYTACILFSSSSP